MKFSNAAYHVWALIEKDNKTPGGRIQNAYCTCTAGLLGCCNHVIGMLFRLEAAVKNGTTNPSCTSLLAQWNVPTGSKTNLVHKPVRDLVFNRHEYGKTGDETGENISTANDMYHNFKAYNKKDSEFLKDKSAVRNLLYNTLKESIPESCFIELMEGQRKGQARVGQLVSLPDGLEEKVKKIHINEKLSQEENVNVFTSTIKLNKEEIKSVDKMTMKQADSNQWFVQRFGRITASNLHKICTRIETLKTSTTGNADNLVKNILYGKQFTTFATKHGKATEPHAKRALIKILKQNNHKKLSSNESGTVICQSHPYLSASPDLKLHCTCCGDSLVEIKCPYTIRDKAPIPSLLPQLAQDEDQDWHLKMNTDHYFQIQGQLGVTGLNICWYFVFTHHGHFIEKIFFNKELFEDILNNVQIFWFRYLGKELLYPRLKYIQEPENTNEPNLLCSTQNLVPSKKMKVQKTRKKHETSKPNAVFVCGICTKDFADAVKTIDDGSIGCDICYRWFHFKCVDINKKKDIPTESVEWICQDCSLV